MPALVRLYVRNIVFGAILALIFIGLLLGFNIANLRHLILASDVGYIAVLLLFVFNTIVFAGVQFGISVMRMAEGESRSGGGHGEALRASAELIPVPVAAKHHTVRRPRS